MKLKGSLAQAGQSIVLNDGGTTQATITTSNAAAATFTLPAATDTIVGRTSTDTLTNKTLTSPTLTTPALGVATATSINKVVLTAPATSATLTIADGKTLTCSNTLTFTGTDTSSVAFGTGGTVAYVANNLSVFAATTSAQLAGVISDETGSGALVFATSPTLVTPVLGVASATTINKITLTAPATGSTLTIADGKTLTVSNSMTMTANDGSTIAHGAGGTVAYVANNLSVFAATTSAQLAGVISDETGSGLLVFATSPTLTTPVLGVATATTVNKVTLTTPATGSTLTIADGKTLTCSNTLTFTGTDSSSVAFGTGGTVAYTGATLAQFAATTSAQLAGVLSDETGSGAAVFATSPTLVTPALGVATATTVNKVTLTAPATSCTLTIADGKTLTCSNTLTFTGTDSSSVAFGTGGTVIYNGGALGTPSSGTLTNCLGLPIGGGGTGVTSVTISPTASSFAGWDASKNLSANSHIDGFTTTATAAGTTTLTVASTRWQAFTGSTTQTVVLPVASTMAVGQSFKIVNASSGVVTVQSSGANTVQAMAASSYAEVTCILASGTTAASWSVNYSVNNAGGGTVTSVAATVPGILTISGSPVTTSGTLAIGATGTSGGVPYFSSTSALASSGLLTAKGVVLGGGAGATPTSTAAGTDGQLLVGVTGAAPAFGSTVSAATTFSGGVVFGNGGTNINWYEEGTQTPTLGGSSSNPTVTYSNQVGAFTRIGRVVYVYGFVQWSAFSSGNGNLNIKSALPYAAKNTTSLYGTVTIEASNVLSAVGYTQFTAEIAPGSSTIDLYSAKAGTTAAAVSAIPITSQSSSGYIIYSGFYFV